MVTSVMVLNDAKEEMKELKVELIEMNNMIA